MVVMLLVFLSSRILLKQRTNSFSRNNIYDPSQIDLEKESDMKT